jgi:phosphohistidine phosphatase
MRLLIVRHAIAMEREDYQTLAHAKAREISPSRSTQRSAAATRRIESLLTETDDDFRPLTEDGAAKMRKNAKGLRKLVGQPDFLVTSPLTRALQTAEILREAWGDVDIATTEFLRPGSEPEELLAWLLNQPQCSDEQGVVPGRAGARRVRGVGGRGDAAVHDGLRGPGDERLVCLVGHEPHLSSFASWIMSGQRFSQLTLKKGGACLFNLPSGSVKRRARLEWLMTPVMLRKFKRCQVGFAR